jgi:hypothetical protein
MHGKDSLRRTLHGRLCYNRGVAARVMMALLEGLRAFLRPLARALRQLWHEVIGAFFLVFALIGAASVWRHWRSGSEFAAMVIPLTFFLVMSGFAVASFRSARQARGK